MILSFSDIHSLFIHLAILFTQGYYFIIENLSFSLTFQSVFLCRANKNKKKILLNKLK